MATIGYWATPIVGGYVVTWQGLAAATADVGMAFPSYGEDANGLTDRSVQTFGGTHGTIHIQGSNSLSTTSASVNWATLNDPSSTALSITTAAVKQVLEHTALIRPAVTNGTATGVVVLKATNGSWRI